MPIYEYKCESCQARLEKLQKFSDPVLRECPECGKDTLVRLVSAPSFRLKGSGWYETDFKTGNKKHGTGEDTSASAEPKTGSTKATDSGTKSATPAAAAPAGKASTD